MSDYIVSPQEARLHEREPERTEQATVRELAHTVATEPDRIRAAVVKTLRLIGYDLDLTYEVNEAIQMRAHAIENGADW